MNAEELAKKHSEELGHYSNDIEYGFIEGYNKSQELYPFSSDDIYDIMDFIARTPETKGMFKGEILKLWKEQRIK